MKKILLAFFSGCITAGLISYLLLFRPVATPSLDTTLGLQASYDQLVQALAEAGDFVEGHKWYGSEREQAEAYRHILRTLIASIEERGLHDTAFPYFRIISPRTKAGMDNPDQRYLVAPLDGRFEYRVWGTRGTSRRLDFALYEDGMQARTLDLLATEDLAVDHDDSFEIIISRDVRKGNWLKSENIPLTLLVRQIHSDWTEETPGEVHIDRIGETDRTAPEMNAAIMSSRLNAVAEQFSNSVRHWPELSRTRIGVLPANWLTPPRDTGAEGGLPGRLMVGGHFDLKDDEALIIKSYPSKAGYQSIQLGHHWWESLDYADRQTSLTTDQARLSSDGAYYYVISHTDPGITNWLDTEGFQRGVIMMRFDGMHPPVIPKDELPKVTKVKFKEIYEFLPDDEPTLSKRERAESIQARRRHVQRRFGN
jgi:hypothetical protein